MSFISVTVIQVKPRANGRNIVGCDMLHPCCIPCGMLLRVVGSFCAKFETG